MLYSGLAALWEAECVGVNITPKELAAWWKEIKVLWRVTEESRDDGA